MLEFEFPSVQKKANKQTKRLILLSSLHAFLKNWKTLRKKEIQILHLSNAMPNNTTKARFRV